MAERQIIQHYRSSVLGVTPNADVFENGEIAINDNAGNEMLFIKNSNNQIVNFRTQDYVDNAINTIYQDINDKQPVISDLETIRSGAAKGETALQSIPSEYVTDSELDSKGYLTSYTEQYQGTVDSVDTGDVIDDVTVTYVTESGLNARGYVTASEVEEITMNIFNELIYSTLNTPL